MLAHQVFRRLPHPPHVGRIVQNSYVFPVKHRFYVTIKAGIAVCFSQRVVPGMEARPGLLHLPDGDGVGQIAVQIVPDGLRRLRHIQHHIGGHGPGVYAGIGAARANDVHRLPLQLPQHRLQLPLDGVLPRLALPAEKPRAVIGDDELIILFQKKSRPFRPIIAEKARFVKYLCICVVRCLCTKF